MGKIDLIHGDCLIEMQNIPDKSIDMILCDLPYGTTACKWDVVIPFEPLWREYKRIIKDRGCIALFGSEPFSSYLRMSNIKDYKYDWVWNKTKAGNFIQAKNMPILLHETISIFSDGIVIHKGQSKKRMNYYPQDTIAINEKWSRPRVYDSEHNYKRPSHKTDRIIKEKGFPNTVLFFNSVHNPPHPTQKPVALLEYLIKTYTLENETVLDNCMGSGSTGVACINTNRNFIGIEKDPEYFKIAEKRIADAQKGINHSIF